MKKKIKPLKVSGSDFDRNEKFGLNNVPKHFDSITDEELNRIKDEVMNEIEQASRFKPGALEDNLRGADGHFESAYNTLEGDYSTRLANLDEVYTKGITGIRRASDAFELQVAEYNLLFEKYSKANLEIEGKELPSKLMIGDDKLNEIKQIVDEICERRD